MYHKRLIDSQLLEWARRDSHKPLLLRGARQVGKSTAVKHLGEQFDSFVEVNLERNPQFKIVFQGDLDVKRIVSQIATLCGTPIIPGKTLLFIDEIQECPEAIMSLRFFKEDMPDLHVIAAGSLLEFAIQELPTFGVGRIHSMFMYPMSFDEFLIANGEQMLMDERNKANASNPLSQVFHDRLVAMLRTYMLVGGMPEVVDRWVQTHDYLQCQEVQDDIILTYEDDFPKYRKRIDPVLLRHTLRSAAVQVTSKFVYSRVGDYKAADVRKALEMLYLAGILIPVTHTSGNVLPLGAEADDSYRKVLVMDTGIMLRLLNMSMDGISEITTHILTSAADDLVNKGPMAELLVGLELMRYAQSNMRHELYYWQRQAKNAIAEIDYLLASNMCVLPVEVKAGAQGGMKSLWAFMNDKRLHHAIRCSLENFGTFEYTDPNPNPQDTDAVRHVSVCPLYAISQM